MEGQAKAIVGEYYIPKKCSEVDFCYCGLRKQQVTDSKCSICDCKLMKWINESIDEGKVLPALKQYLQLAFQRKIFWITADSLYQTTLLSIKAIFAEAVFEENLLDNSRFLSSDTFAHIPEAYWESGLGCLKVS